MGGLVGLVESVDLNTYRPKEIDDDDNDDNDDEWIQDRPKIVPR